MICDAGIPRGTAYQQMQILNLDTGKIVGFLGGGELLSFYYSGSQCMCKGKKPDTELSSAKFQTLQEGMHATQ
jgi:hypothetical protein